ncbi:hypothetical protein OPT61_g3163 [Boeremia exigua]|uniref:Uncharacterized protein n=1 Tax=Boeremia exigua TaxID=749465 RepID=A0ACC2IIS7_9PLEO|nr:hypothetical protein OPT61_g3163 [Boeremia exigua]
MQRSRCKVLQEVQIDGTGRLYVTPVIGFEVQISGVLRIATSRVSGRTDAAKQTMYRQVQAPRNPRVAPASNLPMCRLDSKNIVLQHTQAYNFSPCKLIMIANEYSTEISIAAAIASLCVDTLLFPLDTLITRQQALQRNPNSFRGLYQGFGPTTVTSVPSTIVFFATFGFVKSKFEVYDNLSGIEPLPQPTITACSSAIASLAACAIMSPAETLKQNAQVQYRTSTKQSLAALLDVSKHFAKRPTRLWAGYMMMAASHVPCTTLTFGVYEYLKAIWTESSSHLSTSDDYSHLKISGISAGVAGAFVSGLFVPVDVVTTNIRLAAGRTLGATEPLHLDRRQSVTSVTREIFRKEGIKGFYRGGLLTCITTGLWTGLCLGFYDGITTMYSRGL